MSGISPRLLRWIKGTEAVIGGVQHNTKANCSLIISYNTNTFWKLTAFWGVDSAQQLYHNKVGQIPAPYCKYHTYHVKRVTSLKISLYLHEETIL